MKLLVAILLQTAAFGGCLSIDSLVINTPACVSGTCQTGPGIITPEQIKLAMSYTFLVTGHNTCKVKAPVKGSWFVEVAFYDKDGVRLDISSFYVVSLAPEEKFRHLFEVPSSALIVGPVASAKVRSIIESPLF